MDIITFVFFALFLGVLIWKGWAYFWKAFELGNRTDSPWGPYIWPIKLMIPIGGALLMLQGLTQLVRDIITASRRGNANER